MKNFKHYDRPNDDEITVYFDVLDHYPEFWWY